MTKGTTFSKRSAPVVLTDWNLVGTRTRFLEVQKILQKSHSEAFGRLLRSIAVVKFPLCDEKGEAIPKDFGEVIFLHRFLGASSLVFVRVGYFTRKAVMHVYEILKRKGDTVYTILPTATLSKAVEQMVNFNCGSLLVTEQGAILGIITERLILKAIHGETQNLNNLLVCDFMNPNLITSSPADDVSEVMRMMTTHRVRHLPIIDNGRLPRMISAGDVVKAQFELMAVENHYLKAYIQG